MSQRHQHDKEAATKLIFALTIACSENVVQHNEGVPDQTKTAVFAVKETDIMID